MKKLLFVFMAVALLVSCKENKESILAPRFDAKNCYTMANENMSVAIGKDGKLYSLRNEHTGHDYVSNEGDYLWRIYYDTHAEEEIQVLGEQQSVEV